jgi:predicted O-methyltransferase YrrM
MAPVFNLLEQVKKPTRYKWDVSYKLKTREYPYSCTLEEGLAIYHVISENRLASGYEIATAFGLSSVFIGLGLAESGGKLLTLDCYVEESAESDVYSPEDIRRHVETLNQGLAKGQKPEGLKIAEKLANAAGVSDAIIFKTGCSPEDVGHLLEGKSIDFAFIDGGHFGEQPTLDFDAVEPFLGPKCAVFFHDNNGNPAVARAIAKAEKAMGQAAQPFQTYYRLTLVSRGLDPDSIAPLMRLPKRRASLPIRIRYHLRKLFGLKP